MRKIFSLLAAVLFAGSMMAQVTILPTDFTPVESSNYSVTKDGVTVAVTASTVTNDQMRIFKGQTITVSSESNISSIEFTCTANGTAKYGPGCFNAQAGYTYEAAGKKGTWTGSATSVTFTAESNQVRATQIVVTLGAAPVVATPVISGEAEFTDSVIVTMTCSTQDADIYYTTDGTTDPKCDCAAAPEYKKPIVIKATTTIMAAAYTGNDWSAVATKTFTKKEPMPILSCAEVYNRAKGAEFALNNVTVAYANGKNVYVQDATGSMLLYLTQNTTWEAGNILSGVQGTLDIYNDLYEVKMTEAQVAAVQPGQGEVPAPVEFTAAPKAADMNKYILLKNVKVDSITFPSSKNMNATIGDETFVLRNNFNADVAFDTTKLYDITGVVSVYKGAVQVYFINATEAAAPAHTYTVAGAPAALFGNEWAPSDANNDMTPMLGGDLYVWRKDSVNLTAGDIEFKVCEDHSWDKVYPAQNYKLNIAEAGYYNILIRFNPKAEPDSMIIAGATKVADAPIVGVETIYNWAKDAADQVGTTILGTTGVEINTVKIHENTDAIPGIKFGSSYVYADGKWIAIKPAEGGFKAGDEISLSVVFNNSDVTKYCMADVYAADGATNLFRSDSASTLNGRNAGEPIVQTYTLEADQDSLLLGRYGNTGMFITLLKVTRALVPPTPEKTYTVVGGSAPLFGNTWDPAYEANNMEPITGSEYLYAWKKEGVALTAGTIEYKVCQDHGWATAWPAQGNYNFTIDEAGLYDVTIFFNPELETPTQVVAEFKGAVVVLPNIILHGNFTGSWADTEAFTPAADSLTASLTLALAEGTYEFGFKFDGAWKANGANLTREANTANLSTGEGNMNITADVPGNYIFTYTYETQGLVVTYPEPIIVPDTVAIVIKEDLEWTDAVAKAGWWQIMGENEAYSFSLSNVSTTEVPGIYTVEDLDYDFSYVKPINGTDKIHFVSGQVVVAINTDSIITFVGALTGTDNKVYAFDLAYDPAAVNPYKYDEKDADFIYNFDSYKINTQSAAQGIVGISTNTDSTYISMTIILPQGQTTLVAGEYQVAATPAYQTVYAGYYDNDKKSPAGSMAATLIEQGGKLYYNEIWYLVSGKATVDANLNITVDALNSNSKLIKANLKAQAQGIEDVKAAQKATKSLQNGILTIEKAGKTYNVNGTLIR